MAKKYSPQYHLAYGAVGATAAWCSGRAMTQPTRYCGTGVKCHRWRRGVALCRAACHPRLAPRNDLTILSMLTLLVVAMPFGIMPSKSKSTPWRRFF
jgi:hypothetical protein